MAVRLTHIALLTQTTQRYFEVTYLFFQFLIRFDRSPYSLAQVFFINSVVLRFVSMAQALGTENMSPKLRKMGFFPKQ